MPEVVVPTKALRKFIAALASASVPHAARPRARGRGEHRVLRRAARLQDVRRGRLRRPRPVRARAPAGRVAGVPRDSPAAGGRERGRDPVLGPVRLPRQVVGAGRGRAPDAGAERRTARCFGFFATRIPPRRDSRSSSSPTTAACGIARIAPRECASRSCRTGISSSCSSGCGCRTRSCCGTNVREILFRKPDYLAEPVAGSPRPMRPVVALLTDFGIRDHYAGTMKGVVLSICPETTLVDISHDVPPHDVLSASLELAASLQVLPSQARCSSSSSTRASDRPGGRSRRRPATTGSWRRTTACCRRCSRTWRRGGWSS